MLRIRRTGAALLCAGALLVTVFAATSWPCRFARFEKMARACAVSGQTVTMGTLFAGFHWEEVYIDRGVFSAGEGLKQTYGLCFSVPRSTREDRARLLFFADGALVEAGTYPKYYLTIQEDRLLPSTAVTFSFGPGEKILVLEPAQ